MGKKQTVFHSGSPVETEALARRLGTHLAPGDTLLLSGEVGAGKSHFARALIRSLLAEQEDIPSPTFTLVQTYDTIKGELWHADLYRLSDPDQVVELGLFDAFSDAICLVEWPDRLAELAPSTALHVRFDDTLSNDTRDVVFSWSSPRWGAVLQTISK